MAKLARSIGATAASAHRAMMELVDPVGCLLVDAFQHLALFVIGATTVWSGMVLFLQMMAQGRAGIEDILLLFIYLEIGATVGIYFKTTHLPVRYLIYIAITVLARVLIEIVAAQHRTGLDLVMVAGAILILSIAELVLRFGARKFPTDTLDSELGET